MLDKAFMTKMGLKTRKQYVDHIFNNGGKDVFGKKFKGYSTYPSKWVMMNLRDGKRKGSPKEGYSYKQAKEGNMLNRQAGAFKNSTAPVLSGDFMNDCKQYSTSNSFGVIWASFGERVEHLHKMSRKVTDKSQPFPQKILNMIGVEVNKEVKKKMPKSKTTRVVIGK